MLHTCAVATRRVAVVPRHGVTLFSARSYAPPRHCYYATNSGQSRTEKNATGVTDAPPITPKSKSKVQLRPGPVKPEQRSAKHKQAVVKPKDKPPITLAEAQKTQSGMVPDSLKPNPSTLRSRISIPSFKEIKDMAQQDMRDAVKQGVFAPVPEGASWSREMIHYLIQLSKFYIRGIGRIFVRLNEVRKIKSRARSGGEPISREEYRLITQQSQDLKKSVPFLFFTLLLEEAIPFIVVYAPGMLPSTCVLPNQLRRINEAKDAKAQLAAIQHADLLKTLKSQSTESITVSTVSSYPDGTSALCSILRLSTFGGDMLRQYRITKQLKFLAEDDRLLMRDVPVLSPEQIDRALTERGFIIDSLTASEKEGKLAGWLKAVSQFDSSRSSESSTLTLLFHNSS